jgi:hypothetical protein
MRRQLLIGFKAGHSSTFGVVLFLQNLRTVKLAAADGASIEQHFISRSFGPVAVFEFKFAILKFKNSNIGIIPLP